MVQAEHPSNRFLLNLAPRDREILRPFIKEQVLPRAEMLYDVGDKIDRIYFPESGIVSLVVVLQNGDAVEAGMVGPDSLAGGAAALDGARAINRAVVQVAGKAATIEAEVMHRAAASSASLRKRIRRHDGLILAQAQQAAACNARHVIEQRLAYWLLRVRDLLRSDNVTITQEYLAQMMGVRRTSVTLAAMHLQELKMIRYRRGQIQIVDLPGLMATSCECYEALKIQTARLLED